AGGAVADDAAPAARVERLPAEDVASDQRLDLRPILVGSLRLVEARAVDEAGLDRHHHRGLALAGVQDLVLILQNRLGRAFRDLPVREIDQRDLELDGELADRDDERRDVAAMAVDDADAAEPVARQRADDAADETVEDGVV